MSGERCGVRKNTHTQTYTNWIEGDSQTLTNMVWPNSALPLIQKDESVPWESARARVC